MLSQKKPEQTQDGIQPSLMISTPVWGQDLLKMNFVNKEQFEQVIKCPACFLSFQSVARVNFTERSEARVFRKQLVA